MGVKMENKEKEAFIQYYHGQVCVEAPISWRVINMDIWITAFGVGKKYILDSVIFCEERQRFLLTYKQWED